MILYDDVVKSISNKEKNILKHFYDNKKIVTVPNARINKVLLRHDDKMEQLYSNNIVSLNNLMRFEVIPKFHISLYDFHDVIDDELSSVLPNKSNQLNKKKFANITKNITKYFDNYLQNKLNESIQLYAQDYNSLVKYGNNILKELRQKKKIKRTYNCV